VDNPNSQRVAARLQKVAQERKTSYNMVVTEYLLECIVRRLTSARDLATKATFKGGYVCARVYNSPRYTTDLDLTIRGISSTDAVAKAIALLQQPDFDDGAWFKHQNVIDLVTQGDYGGTRIVARGGLGSPPTKVSKSQVFHVDIGVNDAVSPPAVTQTTPSLAGSESFNWTVYAVETVIAEKLHTMIARGSENSRSRDVFDIHLLIDQCDIKTLKAALKATFTHRETAIPGSFCDTLAALDRTTLERGWTKVMGNATQTRSFDVTFDELLQKLRDLKL